jgi:hypothetical protein
MSSYLVREDPKETLTKIQRLLAWDAGWNGYDALAPDPKAIAHAEDWIVKLFGAVQDLGLVWMKLVNALPSEQVWPSNVRNCPQS